MRRRLFLGGVAAALGAPALVARSSIMPVRPLAPPTGLTVTELDLQPWKVWHVVDRSGLDDLTGVTQWHRGVDGITYTWPRGAGGSRHYTAAEIELMRKHGERSIREAFLERQQRLTGARPWWS